jgi:hypothetical protein
MNRTSKALCLSVIGIVFQDLEYHSWYIVSEGSVLSPHPLADGFGVLVLGELGGQLTHGWAVDVFEVFAPSFVVSLVLIGENLGTEADSLCYVLVKVFGSG